jgi:hypothetical protein
MEAACQVEIIIFFEIFVAYIIWCKGNHKINQVAFSFARGAILFESRMNRHKKILRA